MTNSVSSRTLWQPTIRISIAAEFAYRQALDLSAGVPEAHRGYLFVVSDQDTTHTWRGYQGRKFDLYALPAAAHGNVLSYVQVLRDQGRPPRVVLGDVRWAGNPVEQSGYKYWNLL